MHSRAAARCPSLSGCLQQGRDVFTGVLSPVHPHGGIFAGSYPDITELLAGAGVGRIYTNAQGDIVYDDVFSDYWYFAPDTTTSSVPEPGTIILFATGTLAMLGTIRRRICKPYWVDSPSQVR